MRINLTKEEIVNSIYMQIGYSKKISENLLEDFFEIIINGIKNNNKVKIAKFGTFQVRFKKSRIGRNPKTKEKKIISERKVILFKPSKELKKIINNKYEPKT
jgi:integration host factor subunit alpha